MSNDPNLPDPNQPFPSAPAEGGYGSAPQYQGGGDLGPAPTKPKSIELAQKLMYVGAALSAISLVLGAVLVGSDSTKDAIRDSLRDAGQDVTDDAVNTAVTVGLITSILMGVLGIALWLLMAKFNGAGKSWARIVATVLGALNVIFSLLQFTQPTANGAGIAMSVVSMLLAIAILVLLWRPESSQYYRETSAHSVAR
ncbi:hypothetical protein ACMYYO_04255 [Dermacoccaceae bacterium W4C1]